MILLNVKPPETNESRAYRDTQILVLCDFIVDKFGDLTCEEIKTAYKMYVAKEFKGVKVFKVLDAPCIGEVLGAYVAYRDEYLHVYYSKKQAAKQEDLLPAKSTAEIQLIMNGAIIRSYEEYRVDGVVCYPFNHIFKELVERRFIPSPESENPKVKEWYATMRTKAKVLVEQELSAELRQPIGAQQRTLLQQLLSDVRENKHERIELKMYQLVLEGYYEHYVLVVDRDVIDFKKKS